MSFVRSKEIPPGSGNWYDYEVQSVWTNGTCRQKHLRYIGRSDRSGIVLGHSTSAIESPAPIPVNTETIYKMKTPARQIASAMGMYYGGMPLDAIQQQFRQDYNLEMSESAYWNWIKDFTKEAMKEVENFQPEVGNVWVADETYMKLKGRTIYFWDIIDAKTRYLLATNVSYSRSGNEAKKLLTLARQRAGKAPSSVITDKLGSYVVGMEEEFGADSKHRQGGPFDTENGTALIERFHRTLEQRANVFQKFKNISDIKLLTDGWLINYNFMKQHEGIGDIPPAQFANKVVPFKDWNDIVKPDTLPDLDYKVKLYQRPSAKKKPVIDATLTPIVTNEI